MATRVDYTGEIFGRWEVMEYVGASEHGDSLWRCRCQCGTTRELHIGTLTGGASRSCGCYKAEVAATKSRTHGLSESRAYAVWTDMKQRCYNPNFKQWADYGGRGIKVCARWLHSFENFFADMGAPPPGLTLERKNNDGDYSKRNCKWATRDAQARNRRPQHNEIILTFRNQSLNMMAWSKITGLSYPALYWRYCQGWTTEQILTTPPGGRQITAGRSTQP